VPKKADASGKKKWRIVVDFRKLNDVTIGDSFPIPIIPEILDALGNSRYFSTIDRASGFLQVLLKPGHQSKTSFSIQYGKYHHRRMPFGLKGAPATFQRMMNTILSGIQGIKCLVYMDDIVVFGETLQSRNDRLIEVFDRIFEEGLVPRARDRNFWGKARREKSRSCKELSCTKDHPRAQRIFRFSRIL
jgi:hypothetical protein